MRYSKQKKKRSKTSKQPSFPSAKKFTATLSVKKAMATVFWDHNGVVLAYFLVRPDTVNVEHYCNTQGVCGRPSVAKGLGYSVKA